MLGSAASWISQAGRGSGRFAGMGARYPGARSFSDVAGTMGPQMRGMGTAFGATRGGRMGRTVGRSVGGAGKAMWAHPYRTGAGVLGAAGAYGAYQNREALIGRSSGATGRPRGRSMGGMY